jgi:hypothetical protein
MINITKYVFSRDCREAIRKRTARVDFACMVWPPNIIPLLVDESVYWLPLDKKTAMAQHRIFFSMAVSLRLPGETVLKPQIGLLRGGPFQGLQYVFAGLVDISLLDSVDTR